MGSTGHLRRSPPHTPPQPTTKTTTPLMMMRITAWAMTTVASHRHQRVWRRKAPSCHLEQCSSQCNFAAEYSFPGPFAHARDAFGRGGPPLQHPRAGGAGGHRATHTRFVFISSANQKNTVCTHAFTFSRIGHVLFFCAGPHGLDVCLVNARQELFTSNDGASVLARLPIQHPAGLTAIDPRHGSATHSLTSAPQLCNSCAPRKSKTVEWATAPPP